MSAIRVLSYNVSWESLEPKPNWNIDKIYNRLLKRGFRMDRGYGKLRGKAFRIPHMGNIYMKDLEEYLDEFEKVIHV